MMNDGIYKLLYTDKDGYDVGLNEVQYLENPIEDRIPALVELLSSEDKYVGYQAALILAAWGRMEGVSKLESLIDTNVDHVSTFEPHRITGEDNVYDVIANAINLYTYVQGFNHTILNIYRKLLSLYGRHLFAGALQYSLEKNAPASLLPEIIAAYNESISSGKIFQASQLLPAIAKHDPIKGWKLIQGILPLENTNPTPVEFTAHALKYIDSQQSRMLLKHFSESKNILVSDAAKKSLSDLS